MDEFLLSTIPSPPDIRDWQAESYFTQSMNQVSFNCTPLESIRNQGRQGTCAAQSAACMKEWQEMHDYGFKGHMSPQFIYNNRSNVSTSGMHCRDVMKILSTIGIVPESSYEYGSEWKITDSLLCEAGVHRIYGYAQVTTIKGLKAALQKTGPCLVAFPVYNRSTRMWLGGSSLLGGHAMTVTGYTEEGFIIRNSWGEEWGNKGYCVYPYEDWGAHWEIWATVDAESDVKPEPTPKEETAECPCSLS